jgi:Tol biopolymer transport system component
VVRRLLLVAVAFLVVAVPASATTTRILATQDWWPVQSPSDNVIAFTRVYPNHMELWTVNTDTNRVSHVGTAAGQLFPTWTAYGDLAYASDGVLWVAHPDGTAKHRYPAPKGATAPAARPATKQLAYVLNGDLHVGGQIWAAKVIGHPVWWRFGDKIAFRRDDGVYISTGPGAVTKIFGAANPGDPAWAPDGRKLAFAVGSDIWVAGPGATPAYTAARIRPDAATPAWSPDGKRLLFSWRGGVDEVTLPGRAERIASNTGVGTDYTTLGIQIYSGARAVCPGHHAIVVGARVETGSCLVAGTPKADVIEGTPLWGDVILAGAGNDRIHANDRHTDRVNCGPGRDTVWADKTDRLSGCEIVYR